MIHKILLLILICTASTTVSYGQQVDYSVDLHETQTHKVHIHVLLKKMGAGTVSYQMPVWAPGAYSVTHYGRYVSDFKAFDAKGKSLSAKQINEDRWEISGAANIATISYDVGDSHTDSTSLYFAMANIDSTLFFANGTCLFGYVNERKNLPSLVYYTFPTSWKISIPLEYRGDMYPEGGLKPFFSAKNYDELADAPVMAGTNFQTRSFKEGTATYEIALVSDEPFQMDSLQENIRQIVHAETDFFHDTPFSHYTFLINAPTQSHLFTEGLGALEHANSSAYLLMNIPWAYFKSFGPPIFSHEFFHLWNVKRIHSSLLGPFDYTQRVKTTSLWLSEGITDYYAHTLLTRYGISPYSMFEQMISELTGAITRSDAAKTKSLETLSIAESEFDLGNAMVFYSKGTLVGLMLDVEIRSRTNNAKSLDDVMLALNAEAKKGKTFTDKELIGKVEKIVGLDLQDFYKKYIAGTAELPIEEYLNKMGVGDTLRKHFANAKPDVAYIANSFLQDVAPTGKEETTSHRVPFVFYRIPKDGSMKLTNTPEAASGENSLIQVGDTLRRVNGEIFTLDKLGEIGKAFAAPGSYDLEVSNASGIKHITITYSKPRERDPAENIADDKPHSPPPHYTRLKDATPLQVSIRKAIVGKDY